MFTDFMLLEADRMQCPIFTFGGTPSPGFLGEWTPYNTHKGIVHTKKGAQVFPNTAIHLYVEGMTKQEIADVAAHEATHHGFYRLSLSNAALPPMTAADYANFDRALLQEYQFVLSGKRGFSALQAHTPEHFLLFMPRYYFNNVFERSFKNKLNPEIIAKALIKAEKEYLSGKSHLESLRRAFGKHGVTPDIVGDIYKRAYISRCAESFAWYTSSEITYPGTASSVIPNLLPIYEYKFDQLAKHIEKMKSRSWFDRSATSSRSKFSFFKPQSKPVELPDKPNAPRMGGDRF